MNRIALTHGKPKCRISSHGILALLVSIRDERLDGPYVSDEHLLKVAQDAVRCAAQKQGLNGPTSRAPEHSTHF